MPNEELVQAQREWKTRLERRFGETCTGEWPSLRGLRGSYSPRLDIAVGPFAVGELQLGHRYNELARQHRAYLAKLWQAHRDTLVRHDEDEPADLDAVLAVNMNARCFLAIEIENRVSRKHLLGGALNAIALGRIGILIGWTSDKVRALVKARTYLRYLAGVNKPTIAVNNLFILDREQAQAVF
jgi:hypothetical protein